MSYAISNTEDAHLGFILLSGGPDEGDCLVRSLPADKKEIETPESKFLYSLQLMGELQWERVKEEVRIFEPDGDVVLVERAGRMIGSRFIYTVEALS